MMKNTLTSIVAGMFLATTTTGYATFGTNQIDYECVAPKNPDHETIYRDLREWRVLERLQEFLSPYRLPRKLQIHSWIPGWRTGRFKQRIRELPDIHEQLLATHHGRI